MSELLAELDILGAPLFLLTDKPGGPVKGRYAAPRGWQKSTAAGNDHVLDAPPGRAVAMVCGHTHDVLDIDPRNGGSVAALRDRGLIPPVRWVVETPSGGWHLFIDALGVRKGKPLPGVDLQAAGGFVLVPPTDGYRLVPREDWPDLGDQSPAAAARLRALASQPDAGQPDPPGPPAGSAPPPQELEKAQAVLGKAVREVRGAAGARNNTVSRKLLPLYGFVQGGFLDRDVVDEALWEAAQAAPSDHPYTRKEFDASRASAWGKARPERPTVDAAADDFGPVVPGAPAGPEDGSGDAGEDVRRRFPRLDLARLLDPDRPEREWVVHGLVPAGAAVALVSPAGVGKSLLLLALALDIARGRRSFAGLAIPRRRRVLVVDMENTEDDYADRLRSLGVTPANAPELDWFIPVDLPPLAPLDSAAGAQELAAVMDAYGIQPGDVVVLDSFQRVTEGPENDSDTARAYYRHTGAMLKKRGVTVVRTDNTGKSAEKGARGTSSKRDDVDVELLLTRDAEHEGRLYLRPGKSRLPGIASLTVERGEDDNGRLTYTTAGDPWRMKVADAARVMDELGLPRDVSERAAWAAIQKAGRKVVRDALRVALRERRDLSGEGL